MGMQGMKNSGRISDLPEDIIKCILARLPIQDVVRTSILSRHWRYKWTTIPVLVFDDEAIHHSTFYSNLPPICPVMFEDGLVKFIAEGNVKKLLPSTFNHLVLVHFFRLMFEDISSLSSVLGLITSSPNLKKLVVMACRTTNSAADQMKRAAEYLEGQSHSISCLMKLRYVEMKDLSGVEPEMGLIKLILGKSPSLE
ncbi:hypothetical protein REPUB_Repub01dG0036000 [Reevesia pubescens]